MRQARPTACSESAGLRQGSSRKTCEAEVRLMPTAPDRTLSRKTVVGGSFWKLAMACPPQRPVAASKVQPCFMGIVSTAPVAARKVRPCFTGIVSTAPVAASKVRPCFTGIVKSIVLILRATNVRSRVHLLSRL